MRKTEVKTKSPRNPKTKVGQYYRHVKEGKVYTVTKTPSTAEGELCTLTSLDTGIARFFSDDIDCLLVGKGGTYQYISGVTVVIGGVHCG